MHHQAGEFSELPQYKALSYMWGLPKPIKLILIDGADFEVPENLRWNFRIYVWTPNQRWYGSMLFASVNEISMNEIIRLVS
jgi:hypothetical protein